MPARAGASLQDDLARIVRETGIRLVGPNSIGTVSTDPPMALTANAAFAVDKLRTGKLGGGEPERQSDRRPAVARRCPRHRLSRA